MDGRQIGECYACLWVLFVQHEYMPQIHAVDDVECLQSGEGGSPHWKHEPESGAGTQVQVLQFPKGAVMVIGTTFAPDAVGHQEIRCPNSLQSLEAICSWKDGIQLGAPLHTALPKVIPFIHGHVCTG